MHIYTIDSGAASLAAATAKTILQLVNGSTRKSRLIEIGVSLGDTVSTHVSGLVEFRTQSTAGTSSAVTPAPVDLTDPAAIQTARNLFTVEPTDVAQVFPPVELTPVGSLYVYQFPQGEELIVPVSTRLGIRLNFPDAQTVLRAWLKYGE